VFADPVTSESYYNQFGVDGYLPAQLIKRLEVCILSLNKFWYSKSY